jgi:hypothetical protein
LTRLPGGLQEILRQLPARTTPPDSLLLVSIRSALTAGHLEHVSGAQADGNPLLEQARRTAATAEKLTSDDAYGAYVLAYDAA